MPPEMLSVPAPRVAAPAGDAAFLETAAGIGARLCRDALWDGARCNWLGDAQEAHGGEWAVAHRALGPTLYDGTAGIALFLARLHALTGEGPFRTAARGALRQSLSRLDRLSPVARAAFHSGLSGIAWALALSGEALGEEEWTAAARERAGEAAAVEPNAFAVDVISGSAGAIPALLDLARRLGIPALAAAAARHGDFLLRHAHRHAHGWSWRTIEMQMRADLTGYSHGAAGCALALLELWRATGEARFAEGAAEGFRYERSCFSPAHGNWPDFRLFGGEAEAAAAPGHAMAWCHGAPGIGMSRLRAWALAGDVVALEEARVALGTTAATLRQGMPGAGFSLCHGEAGNAELPLMAAEVLGDAAARHLAEEVGRRGMAWYAAPREPWPCGVVGGGETPSLMLGLAGIGWFYLRLYDPRTESVLLVRP